MKRIKFMSLILVIITSSIVTGGCWNYKEIDQLAIVSGLALDKKGDNILLTAEIISQKGGTRGSEMSSQIGSFEGETVLDAVRNFVSISGKRLYFSHAKVLILSEEISKSGIKAYLDLINRDSEVRSDINLLISSTKTAGEIFKAQTEIFDAISLKLNETLDNDKIISKYYQVPLWMFLKDMAQEGNCGTIPIVGTYNSDDMTLTRIDGLGIFDGDKMVGELTGDETKTLLFIKNKLKGGVLPIEDIENSKVSLEITGNKTKKKAVIKDDNIVVKININTKVVIAGLSDSVNLIDKDGRKLLENKAEKDIELRVKELIKKIQKNYATDIFGFSGTIERQMPKVWKEISSNYKEKFKKIDVVVNANVTVEGSALTSEPIKVRD